MIYNRRGFLSGAASILAAPAIIKADNLMKIIRSYKSPQIFYTIIYGHPAFIPVIGIEEIYEDSREYAPVRKLQW
jgi:hypothetical protein